MKKENISTSSHGFQEGDILNFPIRDTFQRKIMRFLGVKVKECQEYTIICINKDKAHDAED